MNIFIVYQITKIFFYSYNTHVTIFQTRQVFNPINVTILNYQNLVYKILSHYRNLYNYNRDFEEDYFHDVTIALIQAYDTYKDDNNVKFITYASRCIHNKYKDIFKKKSFNEESLDLQLKDDLYLLDIIP